MAVRKHPRVDWDISADDKDGGSRFSSPTSVSGASLSDDEERERIEAINSAGAERSALRYLLERAAQELDALAALPTPDGRDRARRFARRVREMLDETAS
ncbi:hypothetical protein C725_0065 [Pacificimonas flava]|uniref:Uncharacterized protein n=1 Tax=Pacificimonas flava TaxID=1234595 RepID=M2SFJ4_9SPHN|nr:hypothetical protein C725_0065 [Pacificimonas flava]